jgi:hypothetical protein
MFSGFVVGLIAVSRAAELDYNQVHYSNFTMSESCQAWGSAPEIDYGGEMVLESQPIAFIGTL